MKKIVWFVICMMMTILVSAQTKFTVKGTIIDSGTQETIPSATVQVVTAEDETFVGGSATDANGVFTVKDLVKGKYKIKVSYVGYVPKTQNLELSISKTKKNTDLGFITLAPDNVLLAQTEITANASKVKVSGDSLIFNASAYRTPAGSTLEALVKKLPGAKVDENGNITINGKSVNKIMIDGKEFFLNDTQVAMQNIPVDIIDNIKSYDRKSDMARVTGIDDGEDETVLDLSIKKGMNKGWTGQLNGGAGTQHRYASRMNVMRFTDNVQITLLGGMNNVGDRGYGGGGGRGWGRWGGGLRASKNAGMNFATTSDKLETGGSIRFFYNGSDSRNETSQENFVSSTVRSFNENLSQSYGSNINLNSNFRLEWKPDTMTNIIFRPRYNYSRNRGYSYGTSGSFNSDPNEVSDNPMLEIMQDTLVKKITDILVNRNINRQQSYSTNSNFNGMLMINRKLNDDGRNINLRINGGISNGESQQLSAANVTYTKEGKLPDINNRYFDTPSRSRNISADLSYSEPIAYKTYLQFGYRFNYNYNKNDRQAYIYSSDAFNTLYGALETFRYDVDGIISHIYDLFMQDSDSTYYLFGARESAIADSLCQRSEYKTYQHTASLSMRRVTDRSNFSVGIDLVPINTSLDYRYRGKAYHISKNQFNFSPRLQYRFQKDKQTNLHVNYWGNMNQPSLTNLLDIRDDSNPLNITSGNPDLKPSFNHTIRLNYNTYKEATQSGFFGYANGGFTQNNIANRVIYHEDTGVRETKPFNINGNWNASMGGGFDLPLDTLNKYFTLEEFANVYYSNRVGYTQQGATDVKSTTRSFGVGEDLGISYRRDLIEISINGNVNYNHSKNDITPSGNQDTWNFGYGAEFQYTTKFGLTLNTDIGMECRRGYASKDMNTDELLWNAQISQALLNGNLTFMLEINDILGQQSNLSRTINEMMRSDSRNNSIYQYGMLRVSYRFNTFGDGNIPGPGGDRHRW